MKKLAVFLTVSALLLGMTGSSEPSGGCLDSRRMGYPCHTSSRTILRLMSDDMMLYTRTI